MTAVVRRKYVTNICSMMTLLRDIHVICVASNTCNMTAAQSGEYVLLWLLLTTHATGW